MVLPQDDPTRRFVTEAKQTLALAGKADKGDGVQGLAEAVDTTAQVLTTAVETTLKTWTAPTLAKCTYDSATGFFTPAAGRWRIAARVTYAANATGTRTTRLYTSASGTAIDQEISGPDGGAAPVSHKVGKSFYFDGATSFRVTASQASGANLALVGTAPYVNLQAVMQP